MKKGRSCANACGEGKKSKGVLRTLCGGKKRGKKGKNHLSPRLVEKRKKKKKHKNKRDGGLVLVRQGGGKKKGKGEGVTSLAIVPGSKKKKTEKGGVGSEKKKRGRRETGLYCPSHHRSWVELSEGGGSS